MFADLARHKRMGEWLECLGVMALNLEKGHKPWKQCRLLQAPTGCFAKPRSSVDPVWPRFQLELGGRSISEAWFRTSRHVQ